MFCKARARRGHGLSNRLYLWRELKKKIPPRDPLRHEIERDILDLVIQLASELHPTRVLVEASPADSLQNRFGIDSMGRAELALRIENSLGFRLPDSVIANAETPDDLVSAIVSTGTLRRKSADMRVRPSDRSGSRDHTAAQETDYAGTAKTVVEVLYRNAERTPNKAYLEFVDPEDRSHLLTFGELVESSRQIAVGLQSRGLSHHEPVAIMLPTSLDFFFSFFGVLLAGGIPVPLYPPDRPGKLEDYIRRQSGILSNCETRFLLTTEEGLKLSPVLAPRLPTLRNLVIPRELKSPSGLLARPNIQGNDTALLQYTSGSTGDPKGVVLTHSNLLANIRAMGKAAQASSSDVFVSWLPLYHDMGLIGACLGTLYHGAFLALISPISFLTHPSRWLWMIHQHRATLSAAPNFAYELCSRRVSDQELKGLDLSSWRIAFNGAEPVSPETIQRFSHRFEPAGFKSEAMKPVYGLAESSVGLAFPRLGQAPRIERLMPGRHTFVSCGFPLQGHKIRVIDSEGHILPEREIGRIEFQGPSSTSGYFRNPLATGVLLQHFPWIDTGDLGFIADGEVFIVGRAKDVIIRAGRHVFPHELEELVGDLPGIRKGCVAVFGVKSSLTGTERIIIAAETRFSLENERSALLKRIAELSASTLEIPADEVLLVPPRSIPKTSSGKLRRSECARLYETGQLERPPSRLEQTLRVAWTSAVFSFLQLVGRFRRKAYGIYAWAVAITLSFPIAIGLLVIPAFPARFSYARRCVRLGLWLTGLCPEIVRKDGSEPHAALPSPSILVANHASYLDAFALIAALPGTFRFVAKKEFESNRILSPFFRRLGCIFIERAAPQATIEGSRSLEEAVNAGNTLMIFPEGTFTRESELRPFHLGAFFTAASTGVPIVPIAIHGTRSVLNADRRMPRRHAIRVTVFSPVCPEGTGWKESLRLKNAAHRAILSSS